MELVKDGNPINGAVILKIPKNIKREDIFVYNHEKNIYDINPKYNVGVYNVDSNGNVSNLK